MASWSRRAFIRGAATIPFALWFEKYAFGQTVRVRYNARSAEGKKMLKIYADAVTKMRDTAQYAEGNPRSWTFQWYTHQVKGLIQNNVQNKADEIARIYPAPSAWRNLAQEMWNTCQSHLGQPEDYFLPWHRMYVYFFEQIIRRVSGKTSFTLPYWNYSVSGTDHGVIPDEFRMQNDPVFGSLYVDKRNPGVNNGVPIDDGEPAGSLSTVALRQCRYSPNASGTVQGFNMALDFGLHGNVHVFTGNSQNMGSVPWAAYDPVFWMHHCNIDRLWASWNRAGRKNPTNSTFLNKTFVFADGRGNRVVGRIKDFLSIAALNYKYDRYESVTNVCPAISAAAGTTRKLVTTKEAAIRLGSAPVRARLTPPVTTEAAVPLGRRIDRLSEGQRLYLVLRNLQTDAQPGVPYHLYLEVPPNTEGGEASENYVGTINFFHAEHHDHEGEDDSKRFYSFDITDLAKKLKAEGHLAATAELTIVPADRPSNEATPVIGEVELVQGPAA